MRLVNRSMLVGLLVLTGCQSKQSNDPLDVDARELRELPAEASTAIDALATANEFIVFSLDGNIGFGQRGKQREGAFHGFPILGEIRVSDPDTRREILTRLVRGVRENVDDRAAECFDPHHGIQAKLPDMTTMDWVICFECSRIHVHHDGTFSNFTTAASAARTLDRVLEGAGKNLAPAP
jgi:hypothetical protein